MMTEKMHFLRKVIDIVWKLIIFPPKKKKRKTEKYFEKYFYMKHITFLQFEKYPRLFEQVTFNFILPLSLFPILFFSFPPPPFY